MNKNESCKDPLLLTCVEKSVSIWARTHVQAPSQPGMTIAVDAILVFYLFVSFLFYLGLKGSVQVLLLADLGGGNPMGC